MPPAIRITACLPPRIVEVGADLSMIGEIDELHAAEFFFTLPFSL